MSKLPPKLTAKLEDFPECNPPLYLRSGHIQTLYAHFLPKPNKAIGFKRVIIPTTEGDQLLCYHSVGHTDKLIILFHGLAGSSYSGYMIRLGNHFAGLGHHVLLVNHRGAHPEFPEALGIYHSGRSEDMSSVFKWARERHPQLMQIAMGFSMSANILLLNLAGVRSLYQPDFAIAVNGPIDLAQAASSLDLGLNRAYGLYFTRDLTRLSKSISWPISIVNFDSAYTAPKAGYNSANDYYVQCSAIKYLSKIQTPCLVLTAEDDPFIDVNVYRQQSWPHSVHLRIEKHGGHLGYVQNPKEGNSLWLDEYLDHVVRSL